MAWWLELARGPLFRLCLLVMLLGLGRLALLNLLALSGALYRAGDRRLPWRVLARAGLAWLNPFGPGKARLWYSIVSLLFHAGLILTPVLLAAHVALWRRGLGLGWPALPPGAADGLTLFTIAAGLALILGRALQPFSRGLSRFQDFALPPLLLVPFASGFLALHPALNPLAYDLTMLVHVLSGDLVLFLVPFSKMAHCVLLPANPLAAELGWRFPADQGEKVALELGKENEPV